MSRKSKRVTDLNYLILKDKHGKKIFRKGVYSRLLFNFLLIAVQIAIALIFIIKLWKYIEVYLGVSFLIAASFMIYLSNCKGKNEFKIAWLVPLVIFPLFGVSAYFVYHGNLGGHLVKKKLKTLKNQTEAFLPPKECATQVLDQFPDVKGLGNYLLNQGNYYPHDSTSVQYFSCGEDFFPDMFNAIKKAKKFVFLEYFIIDVDETWTLLLELLEQKVTEGVEVRILFDGLGSPIATGHKYQKYLRKKGIKTHVFSPLIPFFSTEQNNRDHRKIVIIDGETAYTGGLNLSNEYMNEGENRFAYWKDNAIRLEGPAIQNLMMMFMQTWNLNTLAKEDFQKYLSCDYEKKPASGLVIPYGDDPFNMEDIAEDVYLYILSNAKKYVHITTPYMVIDNQMQEALVFAAHRGVEVSVIVPSVPDHLLTFCIGKTFLKNLVDNGINVYTYEKGFIHSKTFISDHTTATIGSINLDYRSLFHHFECGTLLYKTPVIDDMESDFQETLKDCKKMEIQDYKKIPLKYRMLGRIFRLFAPLI